MSIPTSGKAPPAAPAAPAAQASEGEVAVWTAVVLAASFLVPGLGVVIAALLAFTRLRHNPKARWVLLGVSVVVLIAQIIGLMAGFLSGSAGPGVPV